LAAIQRTAWDGLIRDRADPSDALRIELLVRASHAGTAGAFLGAAGDDTQWYVKPPNHLQGGKVLVTEFVVASLGRLVGAPVCDARLLEIPAELDDEFAPGQYLRPGIAHGSQAIVRAVEMRKILHRDKDDNASRVAGVFALWDWCWGDDLNGFTLPPMTEGSTATIMVITCPMGPTGRATASPQRWMHPMRSTRVDLAWTHLRSSVVLKRCLALLALRFGPFWRAFRRPGR
jgi:hypothetical protein